MKTEETTVENYFSPMTTEQADARFAHIRDDEYSSFSGVEGVTTSRHCRHCDERVWFADPAACGVRPDFRYVCPYCGSEQEDTNVRLSHSYGPSIYTTEQILGFVKRENEAREIAAEQAKQLLQATEELAHDLSSSIDDSMTYHLVTFEKSVIKIDLCGETLVLTNTHGSSGTWHLLDSSGRVLR